MKRDPADELVAARKHFRRYDKYQRQALKHRDYDAAHYNILVATIQLGRCIELERMLHENTTQEGEN